MKELAQTQSDQTRAVELLQRDQAAMQKILSDLREQLQHMTGENARLAAENKEARDTLVQVVGVGKAAQAKATEFEGVFLDLRTKQWCPWGLCPWPCHLGLVLVPAYVVCAVIAFSHRVLLLYVLLLRFMSCVFLLFQPPSISYKPRSVRRMKRSVRGKRSSIGYRPN